MIDSISLRHFKCFENLDLPLAPLTLLTGVNAAGKSTVIQSLALLRQNTMTRATRSLPLNGEMIQLGNFDDVVDKETGRDSFAIGVRSGPAEIEWEFQTEDRASLVVPARCLSPGLFDESETGRMLHVGETVTAVADTLALEKTIANFGYLCTDRIGPRETYLADVGDSARLSVGSKGEFTPWVVHQLGEQEVLPELRQESAAWTLQRQIEAWLADFFPGAGMNIQPVPGANLVLLSLRTRPDGKFHRPQNVGFGLTHTLPVLTLCLGASPGQVLMIENPEAHLHPAAQAKMGYFLGLVAAAGIQVILESHSDHILNGLRRVVRDKKLRTDQIAVHFFNRRERMPEGVAQVISPILNEEGRISSWPEGFFDQFEKDLADLAGWP